MRDEVTWFAGHMETALQANDHKGGWEGERFDYLLQRLRGETDELLYAHFRLRLDTFAEKRLTQADIDAIIAECADVANFAMMIAHNARHQPPVLCGGLAR